MLEYFRYFKAYRHTRPSQAFLPRAELASTCLHTGEAKFVPFSAVDACWPPKTSPFDEMSGRNDSDRRASRSNFFKPTSRSQTEVECACSIFGAAVLQRVRRCQKLNTNEADRLVTTSAARGGSAGSPVPAAGRFNNRTMPHVAPATPTAPRVTPRILWRLI